ncbi:HPP family protein [Rhodoferax sp. PAMC 29310]|uniref:CBS domain-containing protein n=1 Tax=Rhodoferax sp. PAMC 29310 TaxID=2822760 RepID=UPI001B332EB7|nr:CBS domain-containing protein [Rhodoferax sp. PAMC 29310]
MYFVYGIGGRVFRGSIEQLRQIGGVNAITRARAIQATGREGSDPQSGAADPAFALNVPSASVDQNHRSALAAYAETQKVEHLPQPLRRVDELMTRAVTTLADSATVLEAWHTLAEKKLGQAPVVNDAGTLVGLLSRADLMQPERLPDPDSHALVWQALLAQNVKDLMWTPVPGVAPGEDIRRVASVLLDTGLPGLPVVDEDGLVQGFISRSDILRAVVTPPPLDLWG